MCIRDRIKKALLSDVHPGNHAPALHLQISPGDGHQVSHKDIHHEKFRKNGKSLDPRSSLRCFSYKPQQPDGFPVSYTHLDVYKRQIQKSSEISLGKIIDTSLICPDLFTGNAERILIRNQQKRQIVVPQISVKAIICLRQGLSRGIDRDARDIKL